MLTTPQEYVDSLEEPGKSWLAEFLTHMQAAHSDIAPIMFRQCPMFRAGKSYVLFSVAKEHFTVHTLNMELLEKLKAELPKAGYGRGCVKVKFADTQAKPTLKVFCSEIIRVNQQPGAPEVDALPELSYEEYLDKAFSGGKAKWRSLYEQLRDAGREGLPEFREFFPAINVRWKHSSTFAEISCVSQALRIEFYADRLHPQRNPIKTLQTSANRVAHTVEITDASRFDEVLDWIAESYRLTSAKRIV